MSLLEVNNLSVSFQLKEEQWLPVVEGVSFEVAKGKVLGLVGESGCGKSVTLRALMGLTGFSGGRVSSGNVFYSGESLLEKTESEWRKLRGSKIAMIFQDPMSSLNPLMKVGPQVTEILSTHQKMSKGAARKKVLEMFREVGIPKPELRFGQFPHELSGGLRQRIVIAMALIGDPELVLADEPTTALDVTIQKQILELLKELQQKRNLSMIFITHDMGVLKEIADDVCVMYSGHLIEKIPASNLFINPKHPYTKALINSIPQPFAKKELHPIDGVVLSPKVRVEGCRFYDRCPLVKEKCTKLRPVLKSQNEFEEVACHYA